MVKVDECKLPQHNCASEKFYGVDKLYLPLAQHVGRPSRPSVSVKDSVDEAQVIAEADGLISSCLCAPAKGEVVAIENIPHTVMRRSPAIILSCTDERKSYSFQRSADNLKKDELIKLIKDAGIVGMGGASFPTHVKLSPPKRVDTFILNGCECEPYLACDYRLMLEKTEEIIRGVEIVAKIISPSRVIVGIEDNKPEAIKKFRLLLEGEKFALPEVSVVPLKSVYPQGGEKQLIYNLTRRKVPAGGLPFDVGCLVHNVATCFAIYEAVYFRKPLIERLVTFAGGALKEPKNLWVRIGTRVSDLVSAGVLSFQREAVKVICGGPMMGVALDSMDYPVTKGSSGFLFLTEEESNFEEESVCLRCARCVDVCPMNLLPLEYVKRVKNGEFSQLNEFYINDCIECGCCSYVCPARIPIVHYIKVGKKYATRS